MNKPRHRLIFILLATDAVLLGALLLPLQADIPHLLSFLTGLAAFAVLCTTTFIVGGDRLDALAGRCIRSRVVKGLAAAALMGLSFFGLLELISRGLTNAGVLAYYRPIITVQSDWRARHIMEDKYHEPDPVLFWRPVRRPPYNAQGFRGDELPAVKMPGEFRIFCYGDSNTEGNDSGDWPKELQALLDRTFPQGRRRFRVVNAGVGGYSSFQGLRRFQQEAPLYSPDLVLVSFGWNDHFDGMGAPDKRFRSEIPLVNALQGVLLRYRFYLVLKQYAGGLIYREPESGPRVSQKDYLENLAGFVETARQHGATVVLLTRPWGRGGSRTPPQTSIERVRCSNKALLDFAAREHVRAVDIAGAFGTLPCPELVDSCHFSQCGRRRMAEILLDYLERNGLLPGTGAPPIGPP